MKCLFVFILLLLTSCGQGTKRGKAQEEREQQFEKVDSAHQSQSTSILKGDAWEAQAERVGPKEISIQNLYKAMEEKDEKEFLRQFPKSFDQFQGYFGWDSQNDAPHELYEHGVHYIEYWFYLFRTGKYPAQEKTMISICTNGQWEADAVNYFQYHALNHIKERGKYNVINDLKDDDAKSVLFFLFDGPQPKFDTAFASHLSPSKKRILEELFESGFYDNNENPDPIDYEGSIAYSIADFDKVEHFFIKDIDINNDGIPDKVVSADPYQGNELLLFIRKNGGYEFALKTINFSEDGGHQIKTIEEGKEGFVIVTAFPDRGLFEAHHHVTFMNDHWVLTNTIYKTESGNGEDTFIYICDVKQDLDLGDSNLDEQLNRIPEEADRAQICTKEKR